MLNEPLPRRCIIFSSTRRLAYATRIVSRNDKYWTPNKLFSNRSPRSEHMSQRPTGNRAMNHCVKLRRGIRRADLIYPPGKKKKVGTSDVQIIYGVSLSANVASCAVWHSRGDVRDGAKYAYRSFEKRQRIRYANSLRRLPLGHWLPLVVIHLIM